MLTASSGRCNARSHDGFASWKSAIKLGFREVPQEPIAPEPDRLALRKLRARSKTLIAGLLHGDRVSSLHDQIPIAGARLAGGFSRRIREHGIGLKQVRGDDPIETDDRIESRQDSSSQLALARSRWPNAAECEHTAASLAFAHRHPRGRTRVIAEFRTMVPCPRCRILQLVAIGRTVQGLEVFRAVEVHVFGRRQNGDITAGFEKAGNGPPLDDMLPVVPLTEILLFCRIGVHRCDQHPLPRKRHAVASLRSIGSRHDGSKRSGLKAPYRKTASLANGRKTTCGRRRVAPCPTLITMAELKLSFTADDPRGKCDSAFNRSKGAKLTCPSTRNMSS